MSVVESNTELVNQLVENMSMKRKLEEQRKKEEEERLAAVHKDFLDSFSDAPKLDKAWVKAGTAESERRGKRLYNNLKIIYIGLD